MASAKKSRAAQDATNFEDRFFDLLEGTIHGIDHKVDKLGDDLKTEREENKKVRNRLIQLEGRVITLENKPISRGWATLFEDRKLLYLAFTSILIFLLIVAAARGVNVPTL